MKRFLFAVVAVLALVGCRRTDERSVTFEVAGMTEADLDVVAGRLAGIPYYDVRGSHVFGGYQGVRGSNPASTSPSRTVDLVFDPQTCRLTVKYDSMQIAKANIAMCIAGAGFAVREVGDGASGKLKTVMPAEVGLTTCVVEIPELTEDKKGVLVEALIGTPVYTRRVSRKMPDGRVREDDERCSRDTPGSEFRTFVNGIEGIRDSAPFSFVNLSSGKGWPYCKFKLEFDLARHQVSFRYLGYKVKESEIRSAIEGKGLKIAKIESRPFKPVPFAN